jgi:hypothetical protein
MNPIVKYFFFILILLEALVAQAGLLRFQSETLFTDRKDPYLKEQMPLLESVESSYDNDDSSLNLNTNFSFFADAAQNESDFYLHALSFGFKPTNGIQVQAGRTFNTYFLVRSATTDTLSLSVRPFQPDLTFSAYVGRQVQTEIPGYDIETDLSGGSIQFQSSKVYPFKIQTAYEHLNYHKTDTSENIGKVSASKQFGVFLEPEFNVNHESNLDTNEQNRLDFGLNIYPSIYSTVNAKYSQYELNSVNGWEDPISTIFSQGRIEEASLGLSQAVSSQVLISVEGAADRYPIQDGEMTDGQRGILDLSYKTDGGITIGNQLMALLSFGGKVWADIFQVDYPIFEKSNLMLNYEFVTYEKITSSKRDAYSTQVGYGTKVWDQVKLNLLAEYNTNNFVQDEFKVIGQIVVLEWVEL